MDAAGVADESPTPPPEEGEESDIDVFRETIGKYSLDELRSLLYHVVDDAWLYENDHARVTGIVRPDGILYARLVHKKHPDMPMAWLEGVLSGIVDAYERPVLLCVPLLQLPVDEIHADSAGFTSLSVDRITHDPLFASQAKAAEELATTLASGTHLIEMYTDRPDGVTTRSLLRDDPLNGHRLYVALYRDKPKDSEPAAPFQATTVREGTDDWKEFLALAGDRWTDAMHSGYYSVTLVKVWDNERAVYFMCGYIYETNITEIRMWTYTFPWLLDRDAETIVRLMSRELSDRNQLVLYVAMRMLPRDVDYVAWSCKVITTFAQSGYKAVQFRVVKETIEFSLFRVQGTEAASPMRASDYIV